MFYFIQGYEGDQGLPGIPGIRGDYSFSGPQGELGANGKHRLFLLILSIFVLGLKFSSILDSFTVINLIICMCRTDR